MVGKRDEIGREQEYFDKAARERKRMRADKADLAGAGADRNASAALRKHGRPEQGGLDDEPVAFGRIDLDALDGDEQFYIGKHLITDPGHDILVISWQATAAQPY